MATINMDINVLKKRLEKFTTDVAKNMANECADALTNEARNSIVDFYNHYTPIYYNRHLNFRFSYKRYYKNHVSHINGGVVLLPSQMPDVYSDPIDEVFDRVYAGFHGYAGVFDNKVYEIVDRKTNKKSGGVRQHLRFVPPRMIPSPMDRLLQKQQSLFNNRQKLQDEAVAIALKNNRI